MHYLKHKPDKYYSNRASTYLPYVLYHGNQCLALAHSNQCSPTVIIQLTLQ